MNEQIYNGGFSPTPWQILDLVSPNACNAFDKIYQCVFTACGSLYGSATISTAMFEPVVGHHKTVSVAIKELQQLGIITVQHVSRKQIMYAINWQELNAINTRLKHLNQAGRKAVKSLSKELNVPISQIPDEDLDKIRLNPSFSQKISESSKIQSENIRTGKYSDKNYLNEGDETEQRFGQKLSEQEIRSENSRIFGQKIAEQVIRSIFDGTTQVPDGFELISTEFGTVLGQKIAEHSDKKYLNRELFGQKIATDNIEEKKEEKISEARRDSYIEEEENLSEGFESFEEVELSPEELEEKSKARKERYAKSKERLKTISGNPYKDKPYFLRSVLEEFAENPDECVSSPVRLFIYNFFAGLFDYYLNHRYEGNATDGSRTSSEEPYIPTFSDIEGMYVPAKDFSNIAQTAKEETEGQIEKGEFEDAYGTLKLDITSLPAIDILSLCDWHLTDDRKGILVGTEGFRNIEADDITTPPVDSNSSSDATEQYSDKARNLQYAYFLVSADKNTLTPLERSQKQFIERFVEFDDMFMIEHFKNDRGLPMVSGLSWRQFQPFLLTLQDVSKEQFFQTIYQKSKYTAGQDIKKVSSIFSYKDSQRLNKLLGFDSKATPDKLTEIRPNPYG